MRWTPLFLCLLCLQCTAPSRVVRAAGEHEAVLRVVSWNVNYGLAGAPRVLADLEQATRDADLVFLQETNADWEAATSTAMRERFPFQRWFDHEAAGGQAVLSTRPFELVDVVASPTRWFPAIRVRAESALGPVEVLSVHLHPPVSESGNWVSGFLSTSGLRKNELEVFAEPLPMLVVGDFNEGTSGDAVRWLEAQGLRSVLPEYAPAATTWHWPVSSSLELRAQLDHVAYGAALSPLEAKVLPVGVSDHFPLAATFVRARDEERPAAPRGGSLSISSIR